MVTKRKRNLAQRAEEFTRLNPHLDPRAVISCVNAVEQLRAAGVGKAPYDLASPYGHEIPPFGHSGVRTTVPLMKTAEDQS